MSTSLDNLLSDPEKIVNVIVELTSAKRSDGTTKTWYFARYVDSLLLTSQPTFMPYLRNIGPLSCNLSEDAMFGGQAEQSVGSVLLVQDRPDVAAGLDKLSQLQDYTFAGYTCTIKLGELGVDAYSTYYLYRTAEIEQEPAQSLSDSGISVTIPLSSPLTRLLSQLTPNVSTAHNISYSVRGVTRYAGIPHRIRFMSTTGKATVSHIAAYNLLRFTIMLRFRSLSTPPDANINLIRKFTAITTASNFRVVLTTGGQIVVDLSTGGAGLAFQMTTPLTTYSDGNWYKVIFAVDAATAAYLALDNTITNTAAPLGVPDTPSTSILIGDRASGTSDIDIVDVRLYNAFIPADEARTLFSTRVDGSDPRLVGLWIGDDNTGASLNDYSASNNDAALAGVLNTDYAWGSSSLGEPEQAGKPYPKVLGIPFNCAAHLIDTLRHVHRASEGNLEASANRLVSLKTRGIVLVQTTDYTDNADGTYTMVSAEDEPVTFDATQTSPHADNILAKILFDTIDPIITCNVYQRNALINLMPWPVGYYSDSDPKLGDIVSGLLSNMLAHYREDEAGHFYPDFLLSPLGLGPYGEPLLDFRGRNNSLSFGDIADVSNARTVAGWFVTFATDQTVDSTMTSSSQVMISKLGSYLVEYVCGGAQSGKIHVKFGNSPSSELYSSPGLIKEGVKYFIAVTYDNVSQVMTLYLAPLGGTLVSVSTLTSLTLGGDLTTNAVNVGDSVWGSVQHVQLWNSAKTLAQLQALMATPPVGNESGLLFYAPLSEGAGMTTTEKVTSTAAALSTGNTVYDFNQRWSPKLTLDLRQTPSVKLTDYKHLHPAWEIITRYARNWRVMTGEDVSSSVSGNNEIRLAAEYKDQPFRSTDTKTRYKRAKSVELNTALTDQDDAQRLTKLVSSRLNADRMICVVDVPAVAPPLVAARQCLALKPTDEVRLISLTPTQLSSEIFGSHIILEGTSSYLSTTLSPPANSMTISVRVKVDDSGVATARIAGWTDAAAGLRQITVFPASSYTLRFSVRNDASTQFNADLASFPRNVWKTVTGVLDTSANELRLYVDGDLITTTAISGTWATVTTTFAAGRNSLVASEYFKGSIDEISLWNVALNQGQIQAQMVRELAGTETGLVYYNRLNNNSGATSSPVVGSAVLALNGNAAWVAASPGRSMRVVGMTQDPINLSSRLMLWG